jgi:hypothetical protein
LGGNLYDAVFPAIPCGALEDVAALRVTKAVIDPSLGAGES